MNKNFFFFFLFAPFFLLILAYLSLKFFKALVGIFYLKIPFEHICSV